ncbi:hypothetical protein PAPYR_8141 [Paratrimastix pyriformis]|uniref:Methyltransferase domain-containing protein n=1 Tax=Paratrimastix pyriformis TaxID=342808 RepID=A0ABQ8UGN7_9EUKA|nr:hypothetical protein PAPYR_8141 [Paratrimastix pyriformis]
MRAGVVARRKKSFRGPTPNFFSSHGVNTVALAKLVGSSGRCYPVDIAAAALNFTTRRARSQGLTNITPVQATMESLCLPKDLDLVLFSHSAHEIGLTFAKQGYDSLKQGGLLMLVEPPFHVPKKHFRKEIEACLSLGFVEANEYPHGSHMAVLRKEH